MMCWKLGQYLQHLMRTRRLNELHLNIVLGQGVLLCDSIYETPLCLFFLPLSYITCFSFSPTPYKNHHDPACTFWWLSWQQGSIPLYPLSSVSPSSELPRQKVVRILQAKSEGHLIEFWKAGSGSLCCREWQSLGTFFFFVFFTACSKVPPHIMRRLQQSTGTWEGENIHSLVQIQDWYFSLNEPTSISDGADPG